MHKFQLFAIAALFVASPSYAGMLDFEDAELYGGDDAVISADYFAAQGVSLSARAGQTEATASDVLFAFEAAGDDGTDAFWTDGSGGGDVALAGDLGNYFLKTGTGDIDHLTDHYFKMVIDYTAASTSTSGEIWDIDNTGYYNVTAFDEDGNTLQSLVGPKNLNGKAWTFSIDIDPATGKTIDRIEIDYNSKSRRLGGFALNNLDVGTTHATPVPAAFPLAIAGMAAVMSRRRRAQKATDSESESDDIDAAQG